MLYESDNMLTMGARCRDAMRGLLVVCAVVMAACIMSMGCGTEMTVDKKEPALVTPHTNSAGVLSGAGYGAGGEHYKMMQTLGAPLARPVQDSADGKYKVR